MFLNHKEMQYTNSQTFFKGVIEDIDDPNGWGRVRVRVMGVHSDNKNDVPISTLPWANITRSLDWGGLEGGVGLSSTPQVGTWVYLFFDMGEYDKPVLIGSIAGSNNGVKSLDPEYKTKHTIKTPANHVIQIDDANGAIKITHSNGDEVLLNNSGINISSVSTININGSGAVAIHSDADVNITSGGAIKLKSASNELVL